MAQMRKKLMNHRTVGRVLSVDNFRVYIKIEEELKGTYKIGVNGIYEVARINSYLIIPVGPDRIVALITRVSMKDEMEIDSNSASITLPTSARYVSATMLGTIYNKNSENHFIQGMYSFPALDNPVWYVTETDLDQIFDNKQDKANIDYEKDFYLPIGTSPAFQNYKVKICPDQFFVKHAAILGNTGSGKSCTLTSILRSLFRYEYKNNQHLENAHFVIFDTNGEYKNAFLPDNKQESEKEDLERINAYYYGGEENIKVPYWFMNWNEFKYLLKPSDGTQAPILNRAIGLAKNETESIFEDSIPMNLKFEINKLLTISDEDLKKRTGENSYNNWNWKKSNEILNLGEAIVKYNKELGNKIIELASSENFNNAGKQQPIREEIKELYKKITEDKQEVQITNEQNIDLPIWFNYQELCTKFLDSALSQEQTSNNKLNEYISTLRLRMSSFLNDKRIAEPLMLKNNDELNKTIFPQFLSLLLGDYDKCFEEETEKSNFIKQYNDETCEKHNKKTHQITIIDVSQLPYEVLETVTGLLGRIIFEFVSNFLPTERGKHPIVIILEEAQNYISEEKESVSRTVFERIAREGRKYGISLIVSSQRPSELSKTVLSQCNSFIIHRLQNPDDQKYVKGLVSSANADLLNQLPIIPQQHAIITGDCVRTPVQVRIADVNPTPNSNNPKYIENWLTGNNIPYEQACNKWLGKES